MPRESQLKKRSVRIAGHETSITLEDEFWDVLRSIAQEQDISINQLISNIDEGKKSNLSSALRVYILQYLQNKLAQ